MSWYLAVETEDLFVFVNRETGEVILWSVADGLHLTTGLPM
jgi:hypothetical protein